MSNVIQFLESVGQNADLCRASGEEFDLALSNAGVTPEIQSAIRARDLGKLEALMGQTPLCAAFFPAEEEEENGDEEESPSRESDESTQQSRLHVLAAAG